MQFRDPRIGDQRRKRLLQQILEQAASRQAEAAATPGVLGVSFAHRSPRASFTHPSGILGSIRQLLGVGQRPGLMSNEASAGLGLPVLPVRADRVAPTAAPASPALATGGPIDSAPAPLPGTADPVGTPKPVDGSMAGGLVPLGNGVYLDPLTGSVYGVPQLPAGSVIRQSGGGSTSASGPALPTGSTSGSIWKAQ